MATSQAVFGGTKILLSQNESVDFSRAHLLLITGGARSGKSKLAERLAQSSGLAVFYLATMGNSGSDRELNLRIKRHVERRPENWRTVEEPLMVAQAIANLPAVPSGRGLCLLDCLSLYVSNLLLSIPSGLESEEVLRSLEENIIAQVEEVLDAMAARRDYSFIVVTNEVGQAIVPDNLLSRLYRDLLGLANQLTAARADDVRVCFAGLDLKLK